MSISVVKNNMYKLSNNIDISINNCNILINITNNINITNINTYVSYVDVLLKSLNQLTIMLNNVIVVNKQELHIFFNDYNNYCYTMINKISDYIEGVRNLKEDVEKIILEIDTLKENEFFYYLTFTIEYGDTINKINIIKQDIQELKILTDNHNSKLMVGVRR